MRGAEGLQPDTLVPEAEPTPHRRKRFGGYVLQVGAALTAGLAAFGTFEYNADVNEVKAMLAHTHPYIIEDSPVPDTTASPAPVPRGVYEMLGASERASINGLQQPDRLAIVNMPGFGMVDTYKAAEVFSPFNKVAANWSMHYDNLGIDTTVLAKVIINKAREENVNEVGFDADSMGTIIATKVEVEMSRLAPDITIPFEVMDSPATCLPVLRTKSRSDGYALLDGIRVPGAEYSRFARMAAELYLRQNRIHDFASFEDLLNEVHDQVFNNPDIAANTLLAEQFHMIINSDVEGDLEELGKLPSEKRPVIIFMGAANPARDDVVNTPKSLALLKQWTDKAGLTLAGPYGIENFYHGAQWRSAKEYKKVLGTEVLPQIVMALGSDAETN